MSTAIVINEDVLAALDSDPRCAVCGHHLDPSRVRRYPATRYCSLTCQRRAQRHRALDRAAAAPTPTVEQHQAVEAEMREAHRDLARHLYREVDGAHS